MCHPWHIFKISLDGGFPANHNIIQFVLSYIIKVATGSEKVAPSGKHNIRAVPFRPGGKDHGSIPGSENNHSSQRCNLIM